MRKIWILTFFLSTKIFCQSKVTNNEPLVALEGMTIYMFYDNPITISSGNQKDLTISVKYGTIKKGKGSGGYTIRPDSTKYETELTLEGKGYSKTFLFQSRFFPAPIYNFIDWRHNANPRSTRGIYAYIKDFEPKIPFQVDSFLISIPDSTGRLEYMNTGARWDNFVANKIHTAKKGTTFLIRRVYVSCGGWSKILWNEEPLYIGND